MVNCVVEGLAATAASERVVQIWSSVWSPYNMTTVLGTLFDRNYPGHREASLKRDSRHTRNGVHHGARRAHHPPEVQAAVYRIVAEMNKRMGGQAVFVVMLS